MFLIFPPAKFTRKKPIDIEARMLSSFKICAQPVHKSKVASEKERILPSSFRMWRIILPSKKPKTEPSAIEPKMSYAMLANCRAKFMAAEDFGASLDRVEFPSNDEAIVEEIAYKMSATASSRATIPKTVVVRGPRVLFSFRTSVVAVKKNLFF